MKKLKRNLTLFATIISILFLTQYCNKHSCEELWPYEPKTTDSLFLADSNRDWKYDSLTTELIYYNSNNFTAKFLVKHENNYIHEDALEVASDYDHCINYGYDVIATEVELDRWNSEKLQLTIEFMRKINTDMPYKFDPDSVQNFYLGESFSIRLGGHTFNILKYRTISSYYNYELLDTVVLDSNTWTKVFHISINENSGDPAVFVKGIYFKWNVGLIAYYMSNEEMWFLEI